MLLAAKHIYVYTFFYLKVTEYKGQPVIVSILSSSTTEKEQVKYELRIISVQTTAGKY